MFLIKNALGIYKEKTGGDAPTYDASQGDGGASLPGVPREILERAFELQLEHGTGYDKPWGTPMFRQAAADHYWKLEEASGWTGANIVFAQGGRDALVKIYNAITKMGTGNVGDALVVSRVPWISYNWGPYGTALNVLRAPGHPQEGWRYTPESIKATAEFAKAPGVVKLRDWSSPRQTTPPGARSPLMSRLSWHRLPLNPVIPMLSSTGCTTGCQIVARPISIQSCRPSVLKIVTA